jgi:hypothetical protein
MSPPREREATLCGDCGKLCFIERTVFLHRSRWPCHHALDKEEAVIPLKDFPSAVDQGILAGAARSDHQSERSRTDLLSEVEARIR